MAERLGIAAERRLCLIVVQPTRVDVEELIEGVPLSVGRAAPATIVCQSPFLSRMHASFTLRRDGVELLDLGSRNGVVVGGKAVKRAILQDGSSVRLGHVRVSVQSLDAYERGQVVSAAAVFRAHLEDELRRAQFFHRTFSVLHVQAEGAEGNEGAIAVFVMSLLRSIDRVSVSGRGAVTALLSEQGAAEARLVAHAVAAANRPRLPKLRVGLASYPAYRTVDDLLDASRRSVTDNPTAAVAAADPLATTAREPPIVVGSETMRALHRSVERFARSGAPILILGETGSGKEVIARRVHEESGRKGPFVGLNCGAIAASLLESTLFGHEKGAFTGATAQHRGVFEAANGGTVFLDEIGELPLAAQVALLRVLEQKRVVRVGATVETAVDARVVAATHRDPAAMVRDSTFREDLYYRLNTLVVEVPPLRDRTEEIEPLARLFLRRLFDEGQTVAKEFDAAALHALEAYAWPGNVRELRNVVHRAAIVCTGAVIGLGDLPAQCSASGSSQARRAADPGAPPGPTLPRLKLRLTPEEETAILLDALERAGGRQALAAKELGMPLRTLKYRLAKFGIRKVGYAPR
ncbi:MAG: sigma 54-interacting transcriptional regulator [Polyangiaceae bacterium]